MKRRDLPSVAKATFGVVAGPSVNGLTFGCLVHESHSDAQATAGTREGLIRSPSDTRAALHSDYRKLWFPSPNPQHAGGSGLI
jgi:hypothetical protein